MFLKRDLISCYLFFAVMTWNDDWLQLIKSTAYKVWIDSAVVCDICNKAPRMVKSSITNLIKAYVRMIPVNHWCPLSLGPLVGNSYCYTKPCSCLPGSGLWQPTDQYQIVKSITVSELYLCQVKFDQRQYPHIQEPRNVQISGQIEMEFVLVLALSLKSDICFSLYDNLAVDFWRLW